jgi:hypothetical protein
MITNRDIEIAFVRAQQRINDQIDNAQAEFYMADMADMADMLIGQLKGKAESPNPLMTTNEEI